MVLKLNRIYTIIFTVIKVCLDSNIFISALLFDGKPEKILFMASSKEVKITVSPTIIEEVKKNLVKKFHRPEMEVRKLVKAITSISQVVVPKSKIKEVEYQPDNRILETALEGQVDYIVTGDSKHLLPLKEFKGIPIVTPNEFLILLRS